MLFRSQVSYHLNDVNGSKSALRWALLHSPHLGAVRANLAALELQTKEYEAALANCDWVLSVEPRNTTAHRTKIQALMALERFADAEKALATARRGACKRRCGHVTKVRMSLRVDEMEKGIRARGGKPKGMKPEKAKRYAELYTPEELQEYLRFVHQHGAPALVESDGARVQTKPYASSLEHEQVGMQTS